MPEKTEIYHIDQKYRIVFEQAASSTKQILGFKVEANGDDISIVKAEADILLRYAQAMAPAERKEA